MTAPDVPVLVVVVATGSGRRLEAALASVAWARERAVLDPAGVVAPGTLPAGVRIGRDPAALGSSPWLLLLAEHEVAPPSLAAAVARATRQDAGAWAIPVEVEMVGVSLSTRAHPVRLTQRERSRLTLDRALELALELPAAPQRPLDAALRAERGASVAEAVDELRAEGRALAALLARDGARPSLAALIGRPLAAGFRVLRARAAPRAGLARWIAAVFAGYRVVLAHAMLWEWRHAQPATIREVA